jgi:hypothetical protein
LGEGSGLLKLDDLGAEGGDLSLKRLEGGELGDSGFELTFEVGFLWRGSEKVSKAVSTLRRDEDGPSPTSRP